MAGVLVLDSGLTGLIQVLGSGLVVGMAVGGVRAFTILRAGALAGATVPGVFMAGTWRWKGIPVFIAATISTGTDLAFMQDVAMVFPRGEMTVGRVVTGMSQDLKIMPCPTGAA